MKGTFRFVLYLTNYRTRIMTIHDVKDDPILQVSSQEPATSSKYGLQGRGVPDYLTDHARELKFGTKVKNNIS